MKIDQRGIRVQDDFIINLDYENGYSIEVEARDNRAAVRKGLGYLGDDIAIVETYPHSSNIYKVLPDGKTMLLGNIRRVKK